MLIEPDWPAPPGVRAAVTTRAGGVSTGAYASLNLGDHVGDDPDRVTENRRRLQTALSLPEAPRWLAQVHGSRVLRLPAEAAGDGDGAVTETAGVVCAVLTADCLPVLLARRDGSAVGVAHAGWRGLAAGVLANAVGMLGGPPAAMLAWLGPAIAAPAYEVGADVHDALIGADPRLEAALSVNAAGRWQADLMLAARLALGAAGVTAVYGGGLCAYSDPRFFSHRRQAPCGRMAALIWRDPSP
jgi:YfiH family protein